MFNQSLITSLFSLEESTSSLHHLQSRLLNLYKSFVNLQFMKILSVQNEFTNEVIQYNILYSIYLI